MSHPILRTNITLTSPTEIIIHRSSIAAIVIAIFEIITYASVPPTSTPARNGTICAGRKVAPKAAVKV